MYFANVLRINDNKIHNLIIQNRIIRYTKADQNLKMYNISVII